MTHDTKFDVPADRGHRSVPLGFVGALGSRRTHDDRRPPPAAEAGRPTQNRDRCTRLGLDQGGHYPRRGSGLDRRRDHQNAPTPRAAVARALTGPIHRTPGPLVQV